METKELLKQVRKIEIKSKGLSANIFAGEYHSAFKGRGMMFSEVREYQYGDDIRNIDWNVTARYNHPYVKVFEEERELTVVLMVDVSGSGLFGSNEKTKHEVMTEISAVLSFSAMTNNDKIGLILFSDKIEKFIPPKKGKAHVLRIISELIAFKPESRGTDINQAMKYLVGAIKKKCTAFIISDFYQDSKEFEKTLSISNKKHDIVALQVFDERELELPNVGLIQLKDAETGDTQWVDTSSRSVKKKVNSWWNSYCQALHMSFKKSGVDFAYINTREDYVRVLISLFKKRV
ncbi:MAG: DUF58 domain-containing protein [Bacteroidales bacterium]